MAGYEKLEHVFDKFPKCHMKILLGDFSSKIGREDIFKPKIGDKSFLTHRPTSHFSQ
jgi:hypothetical protein